MHFNYIFPVRTGTEEQKTKRGELIQEVIQIQESERATINLEQGAEDEDFVLDHVVSKSKEKADKSEANRNRDMILNEACKYLKIF